MSIELVGLGLEVGDDESFYLDLGRVRPGRLVSMYVCRHALEAPLVKLWSVIRSIGEAKRELGVLPAL